MASSTTIPIATASPPSVMLFTLMPKPWKVSSVMAKLSGMAISVMKVVRKFSKKRKITSVTMTSVAANLQSQTFRSFEIYIVVTLIYLALALAFSGLFRLIQRRALSYPDRR